MRIHTIGMWLLRIIPALIMGQTLYFKFSASEESVFIFTQLGMEPWGRVGTGIIEAIAASLLLIPRFTLFGAILTCGLMGGALMSHLFILGIAIKGDGGLLFAYGVAALLAALCLVWLHRAAWLHLFRKQAKLVEKI